MGATFDRSISWVDIVEVRSEINIILDILRDCSIYSRSYIKNFNLAVHDGILIVVNFFTIELELANTIAAIVFCIKQTERQEVRFGYLIGVPSFVNFSTDGNNINNFGHKAIIRSLEL